MSAPPVTQRVDLPIEGMTCAACASRIERKLNTLEGVEATVNYATERATRQLRRRARDAATSSSRPSKPPATRRASPRPNPRRCARACVGAAVLSAPVLALAMIPALQFDGWQWLSLALATPVVLWAGWPFHRAAWRNLRHGAATMDTLISLGTLAAWGWSVVALCFLGAGRLEMRMPFELITSRDAAGDSIYFEVASVVTTFILVGRFFEERAKRRSGAALRALLELGAKDVAVLDAGRARAPRPHRRAARRRPLRRAARRESGRRRDRRGRILRGRPVAPDRRARAGREGPRRRDRRRGAQRRRPAGRARDEGRRRHGPGADRPARERGAEWQGASPAPRRSRVGGLRAGRDRPRRRDARPSGSSTARAPPSRSRPRSPC